MTTLDMEPLFPGQKLTLVLVHEVENATEVRRRLLAGELDVALVNADVVMDVLQIQAAAVQVLQAQACEGLVTSNAHSELVYALAASRNISDSLRRFGIRDTSTRVLIGLWNATAEELDWAYSLLRGKVVGIEALRDGVDVALYYKLSPSETDPLKAAVSRIGARAAM